MSLQQLIQNTKKLWMDARVSTLIVDSGITIGGSYPITAYREGTLNAVIEGTIVITPFPITIYYQIINDANVIRMLVPAFTVDNSNLNASGVFTLRITDLPVDITPVDQSQVYWVSNTGVSDNLALNRCIWREPDEWFNLITGMVSYTWTKSTGDLGMPSPQILEMELI